MKVTKYLIRNKSGSEGTYFLNGEYYVLSAGSMITLDKKPVNMTNNLSLSVFQQEVGGRSEILNKIPLAGAKPNKKVTMEDPIDLELNPLTDEEVDKELKKRDGVEEDKPKEEKPKE